MAWNGSGNFQRTNGSFSGASVWEDDANAGFDIVDSRHDNHDQDLAQGINNCLTKDGQNSPTADLNMNTFKHTNVGDGTARNHYATIGQLQDQAVQALSSVGGTANAITATTIPAISAYVTGAQYTFKAVSSNTGATTLKIGTGSVLAVQWRGAALSGGEIAANAWHTVIYDGSVFQLLNPVDVTGPIWGGTTAGTSTAFTLTPTPAISTYAAGLRITFIANAANGAAATLAVSGLAAKTIQRQGTALVGNEFKSGDLLEVEYDGTNFQLLNVASAPLFVDRTNNRVGVGTTTPTSALQVSGSIDSTPDAAGVHLGLASGYASMELCESTGAIIDFTTAGTDYRGRIIYTHSNDVMAFSTANVERYRVASNGDVSIGTTSSSGRFTVQSQASGNNFAALNNAAANIFVLRDDGLITTGNLTASPYNFTTASAANVVLNASFQLQRSTSSLRYKTDVHDYTRGIDAVKALRPVFYKGINDGDKQFAGLIAEEVHDAGLSEFVVYNDEGQPDALQYSNMIALALKAIQELEARVAALEA